MCGFGRAEDLIHKVLLAGKSQAGDSQHAWESYHLDGPRA
jgi:hypothetical protein